MKIKRFIGGTICSNGYIIFQRDGADCYLIDPGYKAKVFLEFIEANNLNIKGILLTHHHYDHVGEVDKIVSEKDCPVYLHIDDLDQYKKNATAIYDGDEFDLYGEKIKVIHTPGHTRGSICLYSEKSKLAFTGDTIFNVDLGRTDLEDGSQRDLEKSILHIINKWSNEITIYPGHGDQCNMKYVRKVNKEFLDIVRE